MTRGDIVTEWVNPSALGSGYDKFARALLLELFDGNGHTYEIVGILRDEGTFGRRIRDLFENERSRIRLERVLRVVGDPYTPRMFP